jgi:hypothetical protein
MLHNRKIVLGAVSLTTKSPNTHDLEVMGETMNEIEQLMVADKFLENAQFQWISLVFRYGIHDETVPRYQRVSKKYGDLPLSIEVENDRIRLLPKDALRDAFLLTTLKVLLHVADKYKLSAGAIATRYHQLANTTQ